MKMISRLVRILALTALCAPLLFAQDARPSDASGAPPHLIVLVRQEIQFGKNTARQKLAVNMAKACNKLNVPNNWIDMESVTGSPEVLSFDPFDSYEQLEQAVTGWGQLYAAHPELAKMQDEIDALLTSQRTVVAERRDDLSYHSDTIDLSEAHFMRVAELHFSPGHESDFTQSFKILSATYEKTKSETPWVVYQMGMGTPTPGFLIFIPMATLKQNDSVLPWTEGSVEHEGEEDAEQLQQIARDAFATSESNLYAISNEMSHMPKKSAASTLNYERCPEKSSNSTASGASMHITRENTSSAATMKTLLK